MWPYPWTHVGTPSHLGHMDRVAATMPSQAHAGAAQEAPDIGQWEGQDVLLVRPSSCNVKGGIPSSRRYLPTYLRVQWSPRLPSLKSVNDKWRELCSEMRLEAPKLTTEDGAIGISWSILEVVKFMQRHKVLHSAWDTCMPLTLIVRADAFPVAGTQWSQLCITFGNWGQLARNVEHQFIIGVAYCDDKDATILANLWEANIKVCVTMCPSWLFTSNCSIDELNFQLVRLNITTYNAPSSLSSCCKLSLTVQHLSGSGRRSIAKSDLGTTSRGCGDGWDYRNIGRSLVYMHLPFGKGPNVSSSPMPCGVPMPRKPHTERVVVLVCNGVVV